MRVATPLVALGCLAIAYACSEFEEGREDPADSGSSVDAPTSDVVVGEQDGAVEAGRDAAPDAIGAASARCPRPVAPKCAFATCASKLLYAPPKLGVEFPFGIVTDTSFVYWATMSFEQDADVPYDGLGTSKIMRVDRVGAADASRATIIAEAQRRTQAIAIAGEFLYWVANDGDTAKLRRVRRDCTTPCTPSDVVSLGDGAVFELFAVDDQTLFVLMNSNDVKLVKVDPSPISVAIITNAGTLGSLTTTSSHAYATAALSPIVRRLTPTGATSILATVPDAGDSGLSTGLSPITTDCGYLYGSRGRGEVWRLALDGGAVSPFATTETNVPFYNLTADEAFVYGGTANGFGLWALPIDGGTSAKIADGSMWRVAVDDVGIYWGEHTGPSTAGPIWMMDKTQ